MKKILLVLLFILLFPTISNSADIWFNPSSASEGDPDYSTKATGYHSLSSAIAAMSDGDTLYFADDTYTASSSGWDVETANNLWDITVSGTSGNARVFRAENDGGVILDAQGTRGPLRIYTEEYLDFHGFVFKNSDYSVIDIDYGDNINFYRCSGYNTPTDADNNYHIWDINLSTNMLLEDCVAGGTSARTSGRILFQAYKSSDITFRRCFGYHRDFDSITRGGAIIQIYNSHDIIAENCVGTLDPAGSPADHWINGISVFGADSGFPAYNIQVLGNVIYDLDGGGTLLRLKSYALTSRDDAGAGYNNKFINNVAINGEAEALEINGDNYDWGDGNYGTWFENNTLYSPSKLTDGGTSRQGSVKGADASPTTSATLLDNIFDTGITGLNGGSVTYYNDFNDVYNFTNDYTNGAAAGDDDEDIDPAWDTATYGYGAYLMQPSALSTEGQAGGAMGAEVLYRYEDGVLGTTALWPWPMEARIWTELGVSVTYSADQGSGENGGIWKTITGLYDTVTNQFPADGATDVSIEVVLTWTNGLECTGNGVDVYFDDTDGTTAVVTDDPCTTESYDPGTLDLDTEYFWKVNNNDTAGTVISFTTTSGPPPPPTSKSSIVSSSGGVTGKSDDGGVTIK